jgi:hypothetical protein
MKTRKVTRVISKHKLKQIDSHFEAIYGKKKSTSFGNVEAVMSW